MRRKIKLAHSSFVWPVVEHAHSGLLISVALVHWQTCLDSSPLHCNVVILAPC